MDAESQTDEVKEEAMEPEKAVVEELTYVAPILAVNQNIRDRITLV